LKCEKLKDLEDALIIWIGQMNAKKQYLMKLLRNKWVPGQQMTMTNFMHTI
jgi:hypothetical protein